MARVYSQEGQYQCNYPCHLSNQAQSELKNKVDNKNFEPQQIKQSEYFKQSEKQELHSSPQLFTHYRENSGLLRAVWHADGKITNICYATGFAISARLVLTCAHCLYLQKQRKVCDSITFIPSLKSGRIYQKCKRYQSLKKDFVLFKALRAGASYRGSPLSQDVALVCMQQNMSITKFPQIGVDSMDLIHQNKQIQIVGYPNDNFFHQVDLHKIQVHQSILKGPFLKIDGFKIYHSLQTKKGHSGGSIISCTQGLKMVVLGVHTHKGKEYNAGIFFTKQILQELIRFQMQFMRLHGIKKGVNFAGDCKNDDIDESCSDPSAGKILQPKIHLLNSLKGVKEISFFQFYQEMLNLHYEQQSFLQQEKSSSYCASMMDESLKCSHVLISLQSKNSEGCHHSRSFQISQSDSIGQI